MLKPGVYQKGSVDLLSVVTEALTMTHPNEVGAIVVFVGITREVGRDGKQVSRLEMESYEEHANRAMEKLCRETEEKHGLTMVRVYHLLGEFKIGEPIVLVVGAGLNRDRTFAGVQEAIHRYKTEPALWKKEVYVEGSHQWISGA